MLKPDVIAKITKTRVDQYKGQIKTVFQVGSLQKAQRSFLITQALAIFRYRDIVLGALFQKSQPCFPKASNAGLVIALPERCLCRRRVKLIAAVELLNLQCLGNRPLTHASRRASFRNDDVRLQQFFTPPKYF